MTVPQPYSPAAIENSYGFPVPYTRIFPAPINASRAPVSGSPPTADYKYPLGQIWIYIGGNAAYVLVQNSGGTVTWELFATSVGDLFTLTGDNAVAVTPTGGNINLLGTTNQITTTGSGSTITWSIPATFVAPGSIASTTTIHSGTSMSSATTITAGTGITATTGNIAASSGNVSASGTVTGGTGVTATTGNVTATAGAVNAGTSMTATLGNITATNGNVVLGTAGNKIVIATGSNASVGTSGNMSGTPGAIVVATTASSATAKIFYARNITGGTPGEVSITAQDGTGFTLTSTGNETSTFNWWIINA